MCLQCVSCRPQQLMLICLLLWRPWEVRADLCLEVCEASTAQVDQRYFTIEGKDVFCDEGVCLVRSMKAKVYELSGSAPDVTFDTKLLKMTGIKMPENELDLGLWARMVWFDPRLKLCNCGKSGKQREVSTGTRMQGNMEDFVWTPDFTIKERVHPVRREGSLLDFMLEADGESSGVNVSFTVNLRVTVKCMYKTKDYPYNKDSCPVTIAPYNHVHEVSTKFLLRDLAKGNILYKDVKVHASLVHGKNGFKVVLDRRGGGVMQTYEFTMKSFLVTSTLSLALSPRYTDVSFVGECVAVAFYIAFDLYNKSPPVPEDEGGVTLLEEVMHKSIFNCSENCCGLILYTLATPR